MDNIAVCLGQTDIAVGIDLRGRLIVDDAIRFERGRAVVEPDIADRGNRLLGVVV